MTRVLLITAACLLVASPAFAMHISEGILPFSWAIFWYAALAPFLALGVKRLNAIARDDLSLKPLVGLLAAVVFIISCLPIPVPTAGTCSHPCGTGLSAVLVGPLITVLISAVALLIQALFLAHGGLSTLGANVFSMGVVGSLLGWGAFKGVRRAGGSLVVAGFVAGVIADWGTYTATSFILAAGIRGDLPILPLFSKVVLAFLPSQLPVGILEGMITAGMINVLHLKRPDLLVKMRVISEKEMAGNG